MRDATLTGSRGAHRLRSALVVGEVAVSLVLVAQAGWLLRSFIRMSHAELGFRTSGILEIPYVDPAEVRERAARASRRQRNGFVAWKRSGNRLRGPAACTP